ncbi:MAG: metallophosphoesterase [Bacteroidota bacterium]
MKNWMLFTAHVNSLDDVSFVLLNGDLVDFGLNNEFNWVAARLNKLKIPYITAPGNHDMLANGKKIFNEMFGPENFTFSYGANRFIVLNTNSRETGFDGTVPDISWLQQQLAFTDEYQNIFVLSHVAPFSADFDKKLEQPFYDALASIPRHVYHYMDMTIHFKLLHPAARIFLTCLPGQVMIATMH